MGLLAVAAGAAGITTALVVITPKWRGRCPLLMVTWLALLAAFVLLMVTAGLSEAAAR